VTSLVLDASIALSWCFNDEASPGTWDLLHMLQNSTAIVPTIWTLEVGNILSNAESKGRLSEAKILEFLDLLSQLNIETDLETTQRGFREILHIARSHSLSTYDASYLELAMRLGLPLGTKDKKLRQVASKLGVKTLPSKLT
jgi:predicted nucleic acid-binding protein